MKKDHFMGSLRKKILSVFLVSSMVLSLVQPFLVANAVVINWPGNSISWINNNFVNLSNSGAYQVGFALSGTLDPGDTLSITARDGSGNIATGFRISSSGGESTGSVLLNFGSGGWREGPISFSGIIFSGGIATQVVASGMTLTGTLDITTPLIAISTTAPSVVSWAISINATTSEAVSGFTIGDISLTNATASGFSQLSSTGFVFTAIPNVSSGTMTIVTGTGVFSDLAWNLNSASNVLSFTINDSGSTGTGTTGTWTIGTWTTGTGDTTPPVIAISSPLNNSTVSGFPTVSGTVSDTGWVASVFVNGFAATIGSGTWSKVIYDLTGGLNTVTAIAKDLSWNTGFTSIQLNRISFPLNTNVELSGTTSAVVTFTTDLSATGVILYGTGISALNLSATGTTFGTQQRIVLTNLLPNTIYFFLVQGQGGSQSVTMNFKTPTIIDTSTASGSIIATSSVYLSGVTASGVTFNSGSLGILSLTSSGSSISIPLNGLRITASGGIWDGVLQAPELTSDRVNLSLSGFAFTGTFYQIGNANAELVFSGQLATVSVNIGATSSGKTARVFRSPNRGVTYTELSSCVITAAGNCVFTTNQLSRFAFALSGNVIPNAFSFTGVTNAEFSTRYVSNPVTVSGMSGQTAVSVSGGDYSINNTPFTALTGAINSGDTVVLRVLSSASPSTATSAVLTIGWVSGTFSVTTKSGTGTTGGGTGGGTTTGSSGGSGGGGGWLAIDNCPSGDTSPSYYDRTCGTWTRSLSGITQTGSNMSSGSLSFTGFNIPPIKIRSLADINFTDVQGNWAQRYILRLVIRGIVNNAVQYRPDDSLTRAEFLKIVINSTGWKTSTGQLNIPFNDVSADIWYSPYVSLAISKGMITTANTSFRPNDPISRAEATKILMTALWATIIQPSVLTFVDLDSTSDLTKYVETAKSLNILSGQMIGWVLRFRPNDSITRAEIAKVVVNAFRL